MYSNGPGSIRDAFCFFMDEKQGHQVSYVQYPQRYHNITKNDIYASVASVTHEIDLSGIDGYHGAYCGTEFFHRRVSLCGIKFSEDNRSELNSSKAEFEGTVEELEETAKLFANCSYEDGTQWGKQVLPFHVWAWEDQIWCPNVLWAPVPLATVCYVTVPSICLLHDIHIFPEVSSPFFLPFAYVFFAKYRYSLFEALCCGDTLKKWWNAQRICLFRRMTSYFFAFTDTIIRQVDLSQMRFTITAKVVDDDVMKRYKNGILEFRSASIMFIIITTFALLNLLSFLWGIKGIFLDTKPLKAFEHFIPQIILSGVVVMVNVPVYQVLFLRTDKGHIPFSAFWRSILLASVASLLPIC